MQNSITKQIYEDLNLSTLPRLKMYCKHFVQKLCNTFLPPSELKNQMLRLLGYKIGSNVFISPDVILDPIKPELITIKDNVIIGWGARIFIHQVDIKNGKIIAKLSPVTIENGAFIGGFATIRPGVTIHENAIVASDSLVTRDVPPNTTVAGIPAKVLQK